MVELLWLLLPVAAASGWYLAKRQSTGLKQNARTVTSLHTQYYKSINYLLNDQTDKAVDVLTQLLEVNQDTIELHFALGYLFRRRGEIDRAIRLHQNLLEKHGLNEEQRSQVKLELGQDFLSAGLLDRAEAIFTELKDNVAVSKRALGFLIEVYQQERDWASAIKIADVFQSTTGLKKNGLMAHYFCEMAEESLRTKEFDRASQFAERAYLIDISCVRASLIAAKIEMAQGRYRSALDFFLRVPEQDDRYINEIIAGVLECLTHVEAHDEFQQRLDALLHKVAQNRQGTASGFELIRWIRGRDAALSYAEQANTASISLAMLKKYLPQLGEEVKDAERPVLTKVTAAVNKLSCDFGDYRCERCGFFSRTLFWQCPSCKAWAMMKSVQ